MSLQRLGNALRGMITRGKVTGAVVGPRTLLQITGLDGEVMQSVELLLPPGYSARPLASADIVVCNVLGDRNHKIALGGDTINQDAIADLAPGEFGFRDSQGQQIVFRLGNTIQITSPTVVINGALHVTGAVIAGYGTADQVGVQTHTHPDLQPGSVSSPPPSAGT